MNIQDIIKKRFMSQKNSKESLHAVLYNLVLEIAREEKGLDLGPYLESVKIVGSRCFIRVSSPIAAEELGHISSRIGELVKEKLENLGKKHTNLDIIIR